jgi:predicted dehydrogenase
VASFTATYDVWATERPKIEIYGSEGTLSVPDPNTFGGPVRIYRHATDAWEEVAIDRGFADNSRGLGLADLALALRSGGTPRASGGMMRHVVELMQAMEDSAARGAFVTMETTMERPAPLDVAAIALREEQQ